MRFERAGGAWCPKQPIEQNVREYLQIDLDSVHTITGVQTQGRYGQGRGQEYAEEYTVEYWRPNLDSWRKYRRWDGKEVSLAHSKNKETESKMLTVEVMRHNRKTF